jgi:hypothetical protein
MVQITGRGSVIAHETGHHSYQQGVFSERLEEAFYGGHGATNAETVQELGSIWIGKSRQSYVLDARHRSPEPALKSIGHEAGADQYLRGAACGEWSNNRFGVRFNHRPFGRLHVLVAKFRRVKPMIGGEESFESV